MSLKWRCHPQKKGYLPDFRYYDADNDSWYFSFVPAQGWLLFYFRPPALSSGRYGWGSLVNAFPEAEKKSGEWRIRVKDVGQAMILADYIDQ